MGRSRKRVTMESPNQNDKRTEAGDERRRKAKIRPDASFVTKPAALLM
ncbi:hypothetical protein [Larkinella humicola]|nr:hypothetical protein [Larkinella humicola]